MPESLKVAATSSPPMQFPQCSTIGDAGCVGGSAASLRCSPLCVGGSAASLPPLRHAPLSRALAPSARLCRAPLHPPSASPRAPRASDASGG